jgi:hypothetical protein
MSCSASTKRTGLLKILWSLFCARALCPLSHGVCVQFLVNSDAGQVRPTSPTVALNITRLRHGQPTKQEVTSLQLRLQP